MNQKIETVVITGVSSFIGYHLALLMTQKYPRVIGTITKNVKDYTGIRKKRLELISAKGVQLVSLDITDSKGLIEFVRQVKPEVWVHHAGWTEGYATFEYDLKKGYLINTAPLNDLYPLLKGVGCHGVIITGSCSEYSQSETALTEDDACWPTTAYGLAKLSETIRAKQLAHQYDLKTRVARVFLPYGQLDTPGKLMADVAMSLRQGLPIELTACEQCRDFIYIKDVANAYQAMLLDLHTSSVFEIYNICSGQGTRLRDLLLEMAKVLGADSRLLRFGKKNMRHFEGEFCYGSNQKAIELLQWRPRTWEIGIQEYLNSTS